MIGLPSRSTCYRILYGLWRRREDNCGDRTLMPSASVMGGVGWDGMEWDASGSFPSNCAGLDHRFPRTDSIEPD
ncbi:hypothetical protein C4D60_Mb05t00310 [Musa balbisiana]|uniref:Uncharacterized protein n=1 Tax=Musa balbisiana TaxID=52838 RepID=A0A4S8JSM7_MUSBA|nr:hypothetical protein C4D60_Mb05t00310 [Musa balbisiana]